MVRCYIFWLVLCSVFVSFAPIAKATETPVSAEFFLQSIEPDPNITMLYDFLDIYAEEFAACKETSTYIRALSYLAANGDHALVRDKAHALERCPALSEASQQSIRKLLAQAGETVATQETAPPAKPTEQIAETEKNQHSSQETPLHASAPAEEKDKEQPRAKPAESTVKHQPDKGQKHISQQKQTGHPFNSTATNVVLPTSPVRTPLHQERLLTLQAPRTTSTPKQQATPSEPQAMNIYADIASQGIYRSGDAGTSRLFRFENTALLGAENWKVSATAVYLNSGKASDNTFTGSYYRGQAEHNLLTEQTAFVPQAAYINDNIEAVIGTTPIGAEVSPLPTFRLNYKAFGKLHISGFQEAVTDSLLSYVGFKDIFTGKSMGRVVKAGAKLGWEDTFAESWFYGASVTGAHLYGENVKGNNAVKGEMYVGKSFGGFALGSYSSIDHFATNLNNYTYGHGGYYSPDVAAASVLFASWEYKGDAGQIKADVSSGYLYEKTKSSDLYYLTSGPEGEYEGKTKNHITLNTGLEGSLDLSDSLSLGGAMRFIESGSFNETRGSLNLKWEF